MADHSPHYLPRIILSCKYRPAPETGGSEGHLVADAPRVSCAPQ